MAGQLRKIKNKSVIDSIPFSGILGDGTVELRPGLYSRAYHLKDVNFTISQYDTQVEIFDRYKELLNSFETPFQILIHNYKADKKSVLENVKLHPSRDGMNSFRQEINSMLVDNLYSGTGALKQDKYLIVTEEADCAEEALRKFKSIDSNVESHLRPMTKESSIRPVTMVERLETLFHIYNQDSSEFFNDMDKDGEGILNLELMAKRGYTVKDMIKPNGMLFERNTFMLGNTYGRALYLDNIPSYVKTTFLSDLANVNAEMLISIHYEPVDRDRSHDMIKCHLRNLNAQISRKQMKAAKEGYSAELISPEIEASKKATLSLINDLDMRDQKVFYMSMCVTVFADSADGLEEALGEVESVSRNHKLPLKPMTYLQEKGFNSSLPLSIGSIPKKTLLTSESCAIFIPYTSQELHQKDGICYGQNKTTKNIIMFDRLSSQNYNGIYVGGSGSGKSFSAKNELVWAYLKDTGNDIYVIDPDNEYSKIAEAMGGEVIELGPNSHTFINPFDMDIDYGGEDNPIAVKTDYVTGMIEIMLGTGGKIEGRYRSIIDRCVKNIYKGYFEHMANVKNIDPTITCDTDASPTLQNLYNEFKRQPEPEAEDLASIIETFAVGSSDIFAHRSNISTDKRFVVYNVNKLGNGLRGLGLYIALNDIWNRMIENRKKDRHTWIYIDEFYLLLQLESSAKFVTQFWRRARKWNGVPTAIFQHPEDLLISPTTRVIANNTKFFVMMNMEKQDSANMMELINLEDSQLEYITNQDKGNGLLYTGNTIIPFVNEYPKESELYNLFNTEHKRFLI